MVKRSIQRCLFLIAISSMIILSSSCSSEYKEYKQTLNAMSTVYEITIYDTDQVRALDAIDSSFKEIKRIEQALNYYSNNSELFILNTKKHITDPSPDLYENIEKAQYYSKLSEAAFDITVQPILNLYTRTFSDEKRPPTDEEIKDELKKVDYRKIKFNNNSISIGQDQEITLGGIAKGYAVEKVIEILQEKGITHALVNAGGNMRALGSKPEDAPWNIGLENPRNRSDYITIIRLNNNSVSTSGDYERYFNENKTFHHIIDPKTGYSATELISVTVVTDNAWDADALSTSIFVLGKEKGIGLANKLNISVLIIDGDKNIYKSKNWKD